MSSFIAQAVIARTGLVAILLTQSGRPAWARWACWFGIASEPAWFYSTFVAHQWGIFALAFLYTFAWAKGVYTFWWLPYRAQRKALLPCGCYVICTDQRPGHPSTYSLSRQNWG